MEDIVRRIKKAGKITSAADWQLNRMLILGKSPDDLRKIVAKAVDFDEADVNALYERVIQNEYAVYKPQYERITHKYIPYKDNLQLQQLVNAQIRNSSEDLSNVTKSMGFMLDYGGGKKVFTPLSQVYNGYIDQAVTDVISGAFDYNTMLRKVCRQLSDSGLRTGRLFRSNPGDDRGIDFPSGWHNRIDVAARRAILTGVSQLSGQITAMNAERLGIDRYEVSWHAGARPDHAAWQGKVYTMEQLQRICGLGTGPGLLGWNCRHEYYLFFPGSERQYTDRWLAEQNAKEARTQSFRGREYNLYQATQKQRSMETNMRAQREKVRLMQEGGADRDDIIIEQCKYQAQLDEYKEFSKKFRLPEQRERVYVDLNGRVAPSRGTFNKYTREMRVNAMSDSNMYARRRAVLGDDTPSMRDFRRAKYDDPEKFKRYEQQYKTYVELNKKAEKGRDPWTPEQIDKAKKQYVYFKDRGLYVSSHFLARMGDPKRLNGHDEEFFAKLMKKPANYKQPNGREVRLYEGYAIIFESKTGEWITMERKAKPKSEWEPI